MKIGDSEFHNPIRKEADTMFGENETRKHILLVARYMNRFAAQLLKRAVEHDASKLESPEVEIFEKFTPLLKDVTFGSDEYKAYMAEMKVAIDHHQANNKHHPEYNDLNGFSFSTLNDPIRSMDLFDVAEMVCDWYAASQRHADGDIGKSIGICAERFHLDEQLVCLIRNTVALLKTEDEDAAAAISKKELVLAEIHARMDKQEKPL